MIHNVLSLNILRPVHPLRPQLNRQAYIIQTSDELRLFSISDTKEFNDALICT